VSRPRRPGTPARGVLVGVDGTHEDHPVLELAFDQAAARGVPLVVAHRLWDLVAAVSGMLHDFAPQTDAEELEKRRLLLDDSVANLMKTYPDVAVKVQDPAGFAQRIAVDGAGDWDLLVLPRHAADADTGLPTGTLTNTLLEYGPTSVVLVPQATPSFL